MNSLFRQSIFLMATITLSTSLHSQNSKSDIGCSLINAFLDSLEYSQPFHHLPKDSAVVFLDPGDLIKGCVLERWNRYSVAVIKEGPIIDSLRHFEPYFVLKGRCVIGN